MYLSARASIEGAPGRRRWEQWQVARESSGQTAPGLTKVQLDRVYFSRGIFSRMILPDHQGAGKKSETGTIAPNAARRSRAAFFQNPVIGKHGFSIGVLPKTVMLAPAGSPVSGNQAALTLIFLTFFCASFVLGSSILRTPFLNDACIFASSTATGIGRTRRNAP